MGSLYLTGGLFSVLPRGGDDKIDFQYLRRSVAQWGAAVAA